MFATRDISKGEQLMIIPPSAMLMGSDDEAEDLSCATAERLVEEYSDKGEAESEYWPYLQYVFESSPHKTVPMGWSEEGKQLIQDIVGDGLDPQEFGSGSFFENCDYDGEDADQRHDLLEASYRIVLSRGWHHVMVPVLDMVNHRNGDWLNVDRDPNSDNLEVEGDYRIVALKDIPKGSQLHNSYNQCVDVTCSGTEFTYITPQIFLDYGFVEQYPRRFAFDTGFEEEDNELGLLIEIDENGDNELELSWLNGGPYWEEVEWLEEQKQRLDELDMEARTQNLPHPHEASAAQDYYQSLLVAIDFAIQAAEDEAEDEF